MNVFAKELTKNLLRFPLERASEIRHLVRQEMDKVFAHQIANEIERDYKTEEAKQEVMERINGVLQDL